MKKAVQITFDLLLIIIGSAVAAFAMNLFLIPNQIAPGGASGLSLVINYLINGIVSTGILIIIINIPLFILSFKVFGTSFAIKSIFGTVVFSILVDILEPVAKKIGEKWLSVPGGEIDLLLFTVYGGVILGIGFGLVIKAGASTGGSGLAAQLLNRALPSVSTGTWLLILDALVIIFAAVAFKNIIYALYSIIVIWISSTLMDMIVAGINSAKAVYIISDRSNEIKIELLHKLKRGVTVFVAKGAYSGNEKNVLLCVVQHAQVLDLKRIVSSMDEGAFVILTDVKEVLGEGFKR